MYLKKNLWNVIICIDSQTKPSSKAKFLLLLLFIMFIIYIIYLLIFFYYLFGIQLGATVNHTWNMFTASASSAWTPFLRFSLLINVITYGALTFLKVLVLRIQKKKKTRWTLLFEKWTSSHHYREATEQTWKIHLF